MKKLILFLLLTVLSFSSQAKIQLAITVDDLPLHSNSPAGIDPTQITNHMIRAFKDHKVPEVYGFINAKKIEKNPALAEVLRLWIDAGQPLGNHTYSHYNINKVSVAEFKRDIQANEKTLKDYSGTLDWHYFRYPFLFEGDSLERRNAIRQELKDKNYKIAQVTVDFEDWSWNNPYARCKDKGDEAKIKWLKKTYLKNARDKLKRAVRMAKLLFQEDIPHILLLHLGAFDAEMLPTLLDMYEQNGVEYITLGKALEHKVYAQDPHYVGQWGIDFQYQIMQSRGLSLENLGLRPYEGYPQAELESACL